MIETFLRPEVFRALADPTRLTVVARLASASDPVTVTEAADCCGVHLSGVSRHLAALHRAGLVRLQRDGREARYELDREALTSLLRGLADALEQPENCCE
ncbi:MAG: ArsR/SmtB family transcription factor [Planctomycetota bacterium]